MISTSKADEKMRKFVRLKAKNDSHHHQDFPNGVVLFETFCEAEPLALDFTGDDANGTVSPGKNDKFTLTKKCFVKATLSFSVPYY